MGQWILDGKPEEPKGEVRAMETRVPRTGPAVTALMGRRPACSFRYTEAWTSLKRGLQLCLSEGAMGGEGPRRMQIWGRIPERRQEGKQARNNKSWYGCYLFSLGIKGDVKGRSKKHPLLPWGEGPGRKRFPQPWENSCQDLSQEGKCGCSLVVATLINNSMGTNQRIEAAEIQNLRRGEAEVRRDLLEMGPLAGRTLEWTCWRGWN